MLSSNNYIKAMSWNRNRALSKLSSMSDTFVKHILKCVIYSDNMRDYNHWIQEISNYLEVANDIELKPRNKKPSKSDYEDTLFDALGNTRKDARNNLKLFLWEIEETHQYPEFEITEKLINNVFETCKNIVDTFVPILITKNSEDAESFQPKVEECIVN